VLHLNELGWGRFGDIWSCMGKSRREEKKENVYRRGEQRRPGPVGVNYGREGLWRRAAEDVGWYTRERIAREY
jgi:hypothetical protein